VFLLVLLSACTDSSTSSTSSIVASENLRTGRFIDSEVEGVAYRTDTLSGFTSESGEFQYQEGELVTLYIGDIEFGTALGKRIITPIDLVEGAVSGREPHVVNILRFLQTLDDDGDPTNGIRITKQARAELNGIELDLSDGDFERDVELIIALQKLAGCSCDALVNADDAIEHFESKDGGNYKLGGTISGLSGSLTLIKEATENEGYEELTLTQNGEFTFTETLIDSIGFEVSISSQPDGQTCNIVNGSNNSEANAVDRLVISCNDNNYNVLVLVDGLEDNENLSLILNNQLWSVGTEGINVTVTHGAALSISANLPPQYNCPNFDAGIISVTSNQTYNIACEVKDVFTIDVSISGLGLETPEPLIIYYMEGEPLTIGSDTESTRLVSNVIEGTLVSSVDLNLSSPVNYNCQISPSFEFPSSVTNNILIPIECQDLFYSLSVNLTGFTEDSDPLLLMLREEERAETLSFTNSSLQRFSSTFLLNETYTLSTSPESLSFSNQTCSLVEGSSFTGTITQNTTIEVACEPKPSINITYNSYLNGETLVDVLVDGVLAETDLSLSENRDYIFQNVERGSSYEVRLANLSGLSSPQIELLEGQNIDFIPEIYTNYSMVFTEEEVNSTTFYEVSDFGDFDEVCTPGWGFGILTFVEQSYSLTQCGEDLEVDETYEVLANGTLKLMHGERQSFIRKIGYLAEFDAPIVCWGSTEFDAYQCADDSFGFLFTNQLSAQAFADYKNSEADVDIEDELILTTTVEYADPSCIIESLIPSGDNIASFNVRCGTDKLSVDQDILGECFAAQNVDFLEELISTELDCAGSQKSELLGPNQCVLIDNVGLSIRNLSLLSYLNLDSLDLSYHGLIDAQANQITASLNTLSSENLDLSNLNLNCNGLNYTSTVSDLATEIEQHLAIPEATFNISTENNPLLNPFTVELRVDLLRDAVPVPHQWYGEASYSQIGWSSSTEQFGVLPENNAIFAYTPSSGDPGVLSITEGLFGKHTECDDTVFLPTPLNGIYEGSVEVVTIPCGVIEYEQPVITFAGIPIAQIPSNSTVQSGESYAISIGFEDLLVGNLNIEWEQNCGLEDDGVFDTNNDSPAWVAPFNSTEASLECTIRGTATDNIDPNSLIYFDSITVLVDPFNVPQ